MIDLAARPSGAWRATRRLATALPIAAVLAAMPAAAQAHSETFVPGQSFEPAKSGFEPGLTAGHAGQGINLVVHADIFAIPFEIISTSFEPR
jgi:hypothetical protein